MNTTELTTTTATNGVATKKVFDLGNLSPEQKQYLKTQIISGDNVTDADLGYFLDFCQFHALNPFMRQIYGIMRKGKLTTQIGIDGLLSIAHRTNRIAAIPAQKWCGEDGVWKEIWVSKTPPVAAKAQVYTKGENMPFEAVAHWSEYAPIYNGRVGEMWAKMPATMLAKCALTLALRRAFPEQLQGLLTTEEMAQAGNTTPQAIQLTQEPEPQTDALNKLKKAKSLEDLKHIWISFSRVAQADEDVIKLAKELKAKFTTPEPEPIKDNIQAMDEYYQDEAPESEFEVLGEFIICENELIADLKKAKTHTDWDVILQNHYENAPFLKNEETSKKVNELKHKAKLK